MVTEFAALAFKAGSDYAGLAAKIGERLNELNIIYRDLDIKAALKSPANSSLVIIGDTELIEVVGGDSPEFQYRFHRRLSLHSE